MEKIYIAKESAWFKTGTEVRLIEYMYNVGNEKFGNFEGTYIIRDEPYDNYWRKQGYKVGDEVLMSEVCSFKEFDVFTKLPDISTINKLAFEFTEIQIKETLRLFPNADINVDDIKFSFREGFIAGFKYLDELNQKENNNETY